MERTHKRVPTGPNWRWGCLAFACFMLTLAGGMLTVMGYLSCRYAATTQEREARLVEEGDSVKVRVAHVRGAPSARLWEVQFKEVSGSRDWTVQLHSDTAKRLSEGEMANAYVSGSEIFVDGCSKVGNNTTVGPWALRIGLLLLLLDCPIVLLFIREWIRRGPGEGWGHVPSYGN